MMPDFSKRSEGVSGPDLDWVRNEYRIVTEEIAEESDGDLDVHPAAGEMFEFGADVAAKQDEKSATRYYRSLKPLVAWLDHEHGIKRPLEATEDHIDDYLDWLMDTSWSLNSRESRFVGVQKFYSWAEAEDKLDSNPAEDVSINDYQNPDLGSLGKSRGASVDERKWIPKEDVQKLWQPENVTSPSVRDELIVKLMWYTTCRPEAVARMRLEPDDSPGTDPVWFDRERGRIRVPNLKPGDEQDAYRWVYYPRERIEPLLDEWLWRRDTFSETVDTEWDDEEDIEWLFLTHMKPRMRASHISRKIKEMGHNAGIQEVTGYDVRGNARWLVKGKTIRHSAITYLANETDVPLSHIQSQAGHSKIETTMQYVHDDEESRRQALNEAWE